MQDCAECGVATFCAEGGHHEQMESVHAKACGALRLATQVSNKSRCVALALCNAPDSFA